MNEEQINAARAAYQRDPETACQALLGCSSEELFITALRGCNQHKHKPGCPDANGGGGQQAENQTLKLLKEWSQYRKKELKAYEKTKNRGNKDAVEHATKAVSKFAKKIHDENRRVMDRIYSEGMEPEDEPSDGRRAYSVLMDAQVSFANLSSAAKYLSKNPGGDKAEEAMRDIEKAATEMQLLNKELNGILKKRK